MGVIRNSRYLTQCVKRGRPHFRDLRDVGEGGRTADRTEEMTSRREDESCSRGENRRPEVTDEAE